MNNCSYFYLLEVDEQEEILKWALPKAVKLITDGKGKYGIEKIKDFKERVEVLQILNEMYLKDYTDKKLNRKCKAGRYVGTLT